MAAPPHRQVYFMGSARSRREETFDIQFRAFLLFPLFSAVWTLSKLDERTLMVPLLDVKPTTSFFRSLVVVTSEEQTGRAIVSSVSPKSLLPARKTR